MLEGRDVSKESEQQRIARMRAEIERQRRKNNSRDAIDKRKNKRAFWDRAKDGE
jgi:hypothetical protein